MERIRAVQRGLAFVLQAAPADHGGVPFVQDPLGQRHTAQALGAAGPFVAGEGVDVGP